MGVRSRKPADVVDLERRRLMAADLFEQGMRPSQVARVLGVTRQAADQWRRRWREGGRDALLSRGMGGRSYLSAEQVAELDGLLKQGPTAHGWDDQRWTLARVGRLIEERFGVVYEISGIWRLLDRLGWSWQVPARRAVERDEEAIAAWCTETWPAVSHPRRPGTPEDGSASRTKPEHG
ncbi:winged helix-turn-helix domain-containing protein [Streptomyces sp. NBC_01136]|uniref:winged helix-turn-helix domain-containing protein n=1 Tax=unclassified Streptomyces TaxID=2593676 RepID=UPI003245772A|nr:winged helix-turn-helix domain-containing protein [Streptomyces sp. NBC_01136]